MILLLISTHTSRLFGNVRDLDNKISNDFAAIETPSGKAIPI